MMKVCGLMEVHPQIYLMSSKPVKSRVDDHPAFHKQRLRHCADQLLSIELVSRSFKRWPLIHKNVGNDE